MPSISEVILMDVSKIMPERAEKYCVCISAGDGKYFYINSEHREIYDDFEIKSSDYSFLSRDSYVSCHKAHVLDNEFIIRKLGNFGYDDMLKILNKIQNSKNINKAESSALIIELEEWLENYQENQLKNIFDNR